MWGKLLIRLPRQENFSIGILIGGNCSKALMPFRPCLDGA